MAMYEIPILQSDMNDNSNSLNNLNHDMPLYAESKLTRKQAISEITDVILRSNMKPRKVEYVLQLLQKFLPSNNTLPANIDELFGAMMSSEHDWRLAQYLIKYKQSPSFSPSSPDMCSEESDMSITDASLLPIQQQESNISPQSSALFLPFNHNELSSHFNDENSLTPYDRLQERLRPITEIATNFNLNYGTSLPLTINNNNNIPLSDQRSQSSSNSTNPSNILERFYQLTNETSSTASTSEPDLFYNRRIFHDDSDHETSSCPPSNESNKLCCFEINGHDLLNGGKRRRYD